MWTISLGALGGVSQSIANQTLVIAQAAANYWGRYVDAALGSIDIQITFGALPLTLSDSSFDLSFSSNINGVDYYEPVAVTELKTGVDGNGAAPDIIIIIDSLSLNAGDFTFSTLSNGVSVGGGAGYDLWTVIAHEIGHGLGLESLIGTGATNRTTFDRYVIPAQSGLAFDGPNPNFGPIQLDDLDIRHVGPSIRSLLGSNLNPGEKIYLSELDLSILGDIGVPLIVATNGDDLLASFTPDSSTYGPYLYGLDGNDTLIGLPTRDRLWGDAGDDLLIGSGSDDDLFGGDGNDTLVGGAEGDTLDGGFGFDTADYSALASPLLIDRLQSVAPSGYNLDFLNQIESIIGTAVSDIVLGDPFSESLRGGAGDDLIDGRGGDDTLGGDSGDDDLRGNIGNDQLYAGLGNDRANGGFGDDLVRASNGRDTLLGGDGNDTLGAGSGGDLLNGGLDADLLLASNGNDRLLGGDGDDTMLGGGGRDVLTGGAGNDRLVGGTENDGFNFNPGSGADLIVDFEEGAGSGDVIRLIGFGAAFDDFADVLAAATQVGANVVIDLGGGDMITLQGVSLANLDLGDFAFG